MALISCPNCGKQISDKARECPQCHFSMETYRDQVGKGSAGNESIQCESEAVTKSLNSRKKIKIAAMVGATIVCALVFIVLIFVKDYSSEIPKDMSPEDKEFFNSLVETPPQKPEGTDTYRDFTPTPTSTSTPTPTPTAVADNVGSTSGLSAYQKQLYSQIDSSQYIIEESSFLYLNERSLEGLTAEECRLARNEIFARHGYVFKSADLNSYFNSKSWYYPVPGVSDEDLNACEKANVALIKAYEDKGCPWSVLSKNKNKRKVSFTDCLPSCETETTVTLYYQSERDGYLVFYDYNVSESYYETTEIYYFRQTEDLIGKVYSAETKEPVNIFFSILYAPNEAGNNAFAIDINYYGNPYLLEESTSYWSHFFAP